MVFAVVSRLLRKNLSTRPSRPTILVLAALSQTWAMQARLLQPIVSLLGLMRRWDSKSSANQAPRVLIAVVHASLTPRLLKAYLCQSPSPSLPPGHRQTVL